MKNKFISVSVILMLIFTMIISVDAAAPSPRVDLNDYELTVTDISNVYVSGTVNICAGQNIALFDSAGKIPLSYTTVGNTNSQGSFKIKVPSTFLENGTNTFKVISLPVRGKVNASSPKTVTIKVKTAGSKQDQTIIASNLSVKVNEKKKLNAKVDSGLPLTYWSKNPDIATIDVNGIVAGRKVGTATIVINQAGNDKYNSATKSITVTVSDKSSTMKKSYTIVYHGGSNLGISSVSGKMNVQKVEVGKSVKLSPNAFKKKGYEFVGWSTSTGIASKNNSKDVTKFKNINMDHLQFGKVKYKNKESVKNLGKAGSTVHLYAVWKGNGPEAAVDWATMIAADNNFMYGTGQRAHKGGCYYCGTNITGGKHAKKGSKWEKTYCCNPFIAAAYVHGANIKSTCKRINGHYYGGMAASTWTCYNSMKGHKGKFKQISKSSKLKPGDIFTRSSHVWMYAGNGKRVEAAGGGFSKNSIRVKSGSNRGRANILIRYYPNN